MKKHIIIRVPDSNRDLAKIFIGTKEIQVLTFN